MTEDALSQHYRDYIACLNRQDWPNLHRFVANDARHNGRPFGLAGVILVTFAIVISVFGFKRPDFPGNAGAARGVMALSIALVAAAMFSIVYVSA